MRFFLFLLANAFLFIRPSEFIPGLAEVEVYRYLIVACLAVSFPAVLQQMTLPFAGVPPIVTCVLLLLPAVFLSGFFHGNFELIQETVIEFVKVLIYFVLLISLVTNTIRLRQFLCWIALFSAGVTLIAVMRYHSDLAAPPATPAPTDNSGNKPKPHGTSVVDDVRDPNTGLLTKVNRMCGTGIFNDPNDFALILVTAIPICLYWLTDPVRKGMRPFWFALLLFFGYALMLTHSRGGFLALMTGLAVLFHLKFGGKRTVLLGLIALPALLAIFAGRMTTISADEGTGQTRIQLWSDGLMYFQYSPLFGIGVENYRQFSSHVAHNSFIHSYAEMGLIGGSLFLGAFFFAVKAMYDLRNFSPLPLGEGPALTPNPSPRGRGETDELRRLHPFLMASLVAYTIGICFLSRNYIVPTYMMLGLAVVYLRLHAVQVHEPIVRWNRFVWPRLAGVSFSFLLGSYVFVRMFVNWR